MTTIAELASAIAAHAATALDITGYDAPTAAPSTPSVVLFPGGHAPLVDGTTSGVGDMDLNFSLVTYQAVGNERDALWAFYGWASTVLSAFETFDGGADVGEVSVLRVLEPTVQQPLTGQPLFAGQIDITVTLSLC